VDTRAGDAPSLVAGDSLDFVIIGKCGIPASAKAVSINVTVTMPTVGGDLQIFPGGTFSPLIATISYNTGQTRANNALIGLGASGDLSVICDQLSGTADLIIDVNGYFE